MTDYVHRGKAAPKIGLLRSDHSGPIYSVVMELDNPLETGETKTPRVDDYFADEGAERHLLDKSLSRIEAGVRYHCPILFHLANVDGHRAITAVVNHQLTGGGVFRVWPHSDDTFYTDCILSGKQITESRINGQPSGYYHLQLLFTSIYLLPVIPSAPLTPTQFCDAGEGGYDPEETYYFASVTEPNYTAADNLATFTRNGQLIKSIDGNDVTVAFIS